MRVEQINFTNTLYNAFYNHQEFNKEHHDASKSKETKHSKTLIDRFLPSHRGQIIDIFV